MRSPRQQTTQTSTRPATTEQRKSPWLLSRLITGLDGFSETVPQFNINGETTVSTFCGGVITFFILMATIAYATNNLIELIEPSSPQINKITTTNYMGNSRADAQNLAKSNFKLAFTLQDWATQKNLNDPRYVQW